MPTKNRSVVDILRQHQIRIVGALLCCGLLTLDASGACFRLSFLEDQSVLDDTCALLSEAGFPEGSVARFRRLVLAHNRSGNRVNCARFPERRNGFYQFQSFSDFTNRTAGGFSETPGDESLEQHTLMCFDVACLLLQGLGCDAPRVAEDFSNKRFVAVAEDGRLLPATLKDCLLATGVMSPPERYVKLADAIRSEAETRLGWSLRAKRRLPPGCSDSDRDLRRVFAMRLNELRKDGFKFPKHCQLGLGLVVNTRKQYVWGDHCFLCLRYNGRYVCIEKNGPKGPYVRVEFKTKRDLALYMSWDLLLDVGNPETDNAGSAVLISLGDELIGVFHPKPLP